MQDFMKIRQLFPDNDGNPSMQDLGAAIHVNRILFRWYICGCDGAMGAPRWTLDFNHVCFKIQASIEVLVLSSLIGIE